MARRAGWVRKYIVPGLVFQAIVISGGYGTGAELNTYFMKNGPAGGLLALLLVTFPLWALVCALTFELARAYRAYDYRSLFGRVLGRGWVLFEGCYFVMLLLVLAVITASSGVIGRETFGLPEPVGMLVVSGSIIALVLAGTRAVEGFLAFMGYALYGVYAVFLVLCWREFGGEIAHQLTVVPVIGPRWALDGARYALYNLGMIPAVLFSVRHAETRREAVLSGVLASAIAVVPAALLVLAMAGVYPAVLGMETPVNTILAALRSPVLSYAFQLTLFSTLIETGAGLIKAVSDRFEGGIKGREAPSWLRPAVATACVLAGMAVSSLGLTALIERYYGAVAWGFLAVYVVPMLTVSMWKLLRAKTRFGADTVRKG